MKEDDDQARPVPRSSAVRKTIIVGVGASAASPASIENFFSKFVVDPDQATVLVLQHREALDENRLRQALRHLENVVVSPVENGGRVEGGQIYVCEPDKITTIHDGRFLVRQAEQAPGERGTIDSFLISLAEDRAEEGVGVILAGVGSDGTLGVATLKDHGGLAIAERLSDAAAESLSEGSSPSALSDFALLAADIPAHVLAYVRHLRRLQEKRGIEDAVSQAGNDLNRIAEILRTRTGNDFHGYKQNTFFRRVQRRMQVTQIDDISAYVDLLRSDQEEVLHLFNDLLIGVTQFFRDNKEFEVLEQQVIPKIFERKGAGDQVRVWVLGCATGEEAYSIGILMREHMATLEFAPHVQIFATDIDGRALASARVGRFRSDIEADVSPERLARWFVREGDTYCVVKELREMCIFSQHNIIKDAPFSKLDLVSCRNLLIYLNADLQSRVIPLFHFALLPDRFLFLGNSENVTRHPKLFAPIDRRARIFKRLDAGVRLPPDFPIAPVTGRAGLEAARPRAHGSDIGLERRAQRVAERYAPAYVIIDEHFQILHFSGRTGRYIEPTAGAASLDLLSLVNRDLRLELRTLLSQALESGQPTKAEQVPFGANGDRRSVTIIVEPVHEKRDGSRNLIVLFRDGPDVVSNEETAGTGTLARTEHVDNLESELRATRERLQATIEELESTNEELKSSNEEYQSLNEELQSANEELETSREELQSVNEELTTVNGELAHRVQELTRATSDLKNFLESTQIATVFLDNDLRIMNFTPAVTQVLHLVDTDMGRPIQHIKARIPIEDLYEEVRRVLRTLGSAEREIAAPDTNTRYIARILPYRSIDNFIAGVVITFVNVTAITQAEERHRLLLAELQHRVRNTLGVVRSIIRLSVNSHMSVEEYAAVIDGRLNAFARTQALVTRDPEAGVDIEMLIAEELLAYQVREGDQVQVFGPPLRLQPKAAETLALAIHELATNAIKYGSLGHRSGRIEVTWTIEHETTPARLILHWNESGGPKVSKPKHSGFGTEMIEKTMAYELKAKTKLAYERDGLNCTIEIPLTSRVVKSA